MIDAPESTDVLILGAGGAGLMCAIHAARRGRRVVVLDHSKTLGGKILISGGGRCNFTNLSVTAGNYVSNNPHFCKSALSRYPSATFIDWVRSHGISYHERKHGQLFCDHSARDIVNMLETECKDAGVEITLHCTIHTVDALTAHPTARFNVSTSRGSFTAQSLVIATGGLSLPKLGATDFGFRIARQFGLKTIPTAPALDGFTLSHDQLQLFSPLSGIAVDASIACNGITFQENLLFTHSGLSGPVALQASLHWNPGDTITINLLPGHSILDWLSEQKNLGNRSLIKNLLAERLPARLSTVICDLVLPKQVPLIQTSQKDIERIAQAVHAWTLTPSGTVGYSKAEVTRGGVDTDALSSKTMECKTVPGLFFIGEVVDVTGWLGGYNFQWAWASGFAAGQAV